MAYNTPTGQAPLNLQNQIDALNSNLSGNYGVSQGAANQAYSGIQALGGTPTSTPMYSAPNAAGGLSSYMLTPPAASALTQTLTGGSPNIRTASTTAAAPAETPATTVGRGISQRTPLANALTGPGNGVQYSANTGTTTNGITGTGNSTYTPNASTIAPVPLTINGQTYSQINSNLGNALAPLVGQTINVNGTPMKVTTVDGGYLLNGLPLNVVMGMGWINGQQQALAQNNPQGAPYTAPAQVNLGNSTNAVNGQTTTLGNQAAQENTGTTSQAGNPVTNNSNVQNLLQQLMNMSLGLGSGAQSQLGANSNVAKDMNQYLNLISQLAQQTAANQTQAVNTFANQAGTVSNNLLGQIMPTLSNAMSNFNTGLQPGTLAALTSQAIDLPAQQYDQGLSALKTNLLDRGFNGGTTPGNIGALIQGYGPLIAARNAQTEQGLENVALQNQQALQQNQQLGVSAANTGAGLTQGLGNMYANLASNLGNVFNPAAELNTTNSALSNILGQSEAGVNAGMTAQQLANQLGQTQANNAPGSLGRLLLSSLLSTIAAPGVLGSGSNSTSILGGLINILTGSNGFTGNTSGGNLIDSLLSGTNEDYSSLLDSLQNP